MKELTEREMLEVNGGWRETAGGYAAGKAVEAARDLGEAVARDLTRISGERYSDRNYRERQRDRREGRGGRSHERSHRGGEGGSRSNR